MIPLKLSVKNFLSYRDNVPVLDLEGVHVACLCGDNGHGKSALLDAITWVLWGTARARVQEELVYQGESEMQVDLEFQAGDGRYGWPGGLPVPPGDVRGPRSWSFSASPKRGISPLRVIR